MISVLLDTWYRHDHILLVLATTIWLCGSLSLFLLLQRSLEFGPTRQRQWIAIAATTGGIGVWATHFVAMLGHHGDMPVNYDIGLTAFSIAEVITLFWLGLRIFTRDHSLRNQIWAGILASAGVTSMHFTGMAAAQNVELHYVAGPIAWAIGLSTPMFVAAFMVFSRTRASLQVMLPALCAIISVCTLHFTVMAATSMTMGGMMAHMHAGLDRAALIPMIVVAILSLVAATVVAMRLDRYLTDLRGLADATLEGLAIMQGGRIVEVNARFAQMLDIEPRAAIGESPKTWLTTLDNLDLLTTWTGVVEVVPAGSADLDCVFEVATHQIEYRGRDCVVLALRDLTEKKAAQRQIEHMARHDALTDLPNRVLLNERLAHGLALARREEQHLALIALDLDRFKAVNDIFGHAAGDEVLRRVAAILRASARSTDTVARIGGDEFMILQVGAQQPEGAQTLIDRIFKGFAEEMDTTRDPTAVGVSIGVAVFPEDATDAENLKHGADIALYRSKQSGRGAASFFDQEMDVAVRERRALEHDLRHAVLRGQIDVAYQPLVNTDDGLVAGYEALMRWTHPERGEISPDLFVPIAEEAGSIVQLGEWILREACRAAANWHDHLFLAVNVSPIQFQIPNLADNIETILTETGFPAERLELEITESVLMKNRDEALATLNRLKAKGIRIVMDDFGTGYSSLSNLQCFPFDKIKIDRSFVGMMEGDAAARSIIRAIVGIGKSLSLPVVAEGVETEAQHRMIREEGCPHAQGYLFGRPERLGPVVSGERHAVSSS